jgi:hypothetical protein
MMIAVQRVRNFFSNRVITYPMENIPVCYVLKKRPEKHTPKEYEQDSTKGIIEALVAVIEHVNNYRQIHSPDHQRVRFGQHFQEIVLKQTSLPLIMNFFKMHAAKIGKLGVVRGQ